MELFEKAKMAVSLVSFFETELSAKAVTTNASLRFDVCPSCGTSHAGSLKVSVRGDQWRCHKCGTGGSVVDAAGYAWEMSAVDAAKKLAGDPDRYPVARVPQQDKAVQKADEIAREEALSAVFALLLNAIPANADDPVCLNYLVQERGIPEEVVREAQRRKIIGFLPSDPTKAIRFLIDSVGEELLKASGLWKEGAKMPGICYRPIVAFLPGGYSAEFRLSRKPRDDAERKSLRYGATRFPWFWKGQEQRVMVVEGVIDLLSAVALGFNGHVIGVTGCNQWKPEWFQELREKRDVRMFYVALDNDDSEMNPGQVWASKMSDEMKRLNLPNQIRKPPKGCDINDILRNKKGVKK